MDVSILDKYFKENPSRREAFTSILPDFKDDSCFCVKKTAGGLTPRKSIYVDGHRHILSVRSIVAYLVRGEYALWVPRVTCEEGCINPHHQLEMTKGVHEKQHGLSADQRAVNALADTLGVQRPTTGTHEALAMPPGGIDDTTKDQHTLNSFAHTMTQTRETPSQVMAAE